MHNCCTGLCTTGRVLGAAPGGTPRVCGRRRVSPASRVRVGPPPPSRRPSTAATPPLPCRGITPDTVGDRRPCDGHVAARGVVGVLGHHRRDTPAVSRPSSTPAPAARRPQSGASAPTPPTPLASPHDWSTSASAGRAHRPRVQPTRVALRAVAQRALHRGEKSRLSALLRAASRPARRACSIVRRVSQDTSLSGAPGADPEPSWRTRFKPSDKAPLAGAFVISAGDPHRYGVVTSARAAARAHAVSHRQRQHLPVV